ncbi:MAG: hypothetical protein JXA03_06675, partial [Bacteroidales bacterium]|nr:hypothetical protein [Bacteroidales bacterium]
MKKRNFTLQKLLLVCVFCCIHFFAFAQPELVKDINPNSNKMGSSPAELVEFNGMLYFIAEDEVHGEELWKSDGTEAGTIMVKDIYPGKNDGCWGQLTVAGGWLYFVGRDQSHGIELWKSDGTENGTVMVKDIYPGEYSGTPEYLTELNGEVFFSARNASNNTQLWKSDGTEAGTMQVSTNCSRPKNITNVNGTLFFSCNEQYIEISFEPPEGLVYIDLYKSDGTTPGTVIISTLYGGMIIGGMPYEIEVDNFIYANNLVFFQFSFDDQAGWFNESRTTLYTYNGSLLQALLTGKYNNDSDTYIGINDILYFTHNSYSNGNSLWRSDGTLGNTYEIYNFECNEIDNFASFNGTLYFTGRTYNYTNILKLYQCDGVNVTELKSFGDYSATIGTIFQNSLYFTARPYEGSSELWKITGSNTTFIESYPFISILGAYNNSMFMELNEGIHGNEFWKSNGNPGGSMLIKDINFGSADSDPENLTAFSNTILFSANDGSHGIEIWKSDGSTAGTALLKDICVGVEDSEPQYFTNFNNITIFNANDGINGGELWKTDGSTSGTVLIKDIYPGTEGSYPYHITRSGSNVYFTAYTATNGRELWKTNGSASGTVLLKDIYPGSSLHHAPEKLVDGNGVLFFTAEGDPYGRELWKSSGTSATTVIVKDIYSGSTGSYPDYLTFSNGWLFFSASSSGNGEELWKSNGTGSGTVMVKDIRPGSSSSGPEYLTFSNGILFFSAGSSENGRELWRSDGTENGTVLVRDIIQGSSGSEPEDLIDVNGTLFFTAEDGINGRELWKSDGTENGTILVKDMNPGTGDGSYYDFFNVNGTLFFTFFNEVLGMELWKTNGFEFGTVLVDDLYEGDNSSTPKYLASISNNIYFAADDGPGHGRELWRYENVDIILPPENLHAELLNFTDVKLTWEAPQPPKGKLLKALEGFNVYRNNQLLNPAPLTTLTYNDPGRPAGLYNYYVTSVYSAEESDPSNNEEVLVTTQFTVDLKCFLEGPFNGTDMDPWLNDVIPLNQPFDTIPWNYNGIEKVQAIPGPDIVDWVLVEIRETAGEAAYATPETRVAIKAAFLLSNGSVVDQDGISPLVFNHKVYGSLYAVIYHRNHIPVLSQLPLQLNDHTFTYDFTTGADKVYGGSLSYKQLAPGIWGLSGGDGNADEFVNNADKNDIWVPQAGQSGYRQGDFDLNRQVNNGDKLDIWVVNTGLGGQLPPPFTCGDSIIDLRDGKKYSTLSIGTQCWMGENMNTGTMLNGNEEQENNGIIEKYCYDNDSANCGEYGGLYKWDEAMQYVTTEGSKGICPPTGGWHIPADEEWKMLEGAVDSQFDYPDSEWDGTGWRGFDAGLNLKTTTGWYGGGNGTDLFGFSAKPAGFRNTGGDFQSLFEGTFFWTSKEYQLVDKWRRGYDWNHESSNRYYVSKYYAPSVRCIKDSVLNNPPNQPGEPIPFNGAVQISLDTLLSWSCTDPDSDAITYSVYLGLSPEPGFFLKDLTASQCNTGPLIADTLYYWKVVATDTRGDSTISPVWAFHTTSFECGGLLLDSRDNRVYKTILIGNQCWMAENLNIG